MPRFESAAYRHVCVLVPGVITNTTAGYLLFRYLLELILMVVEAEPLSECFPSVYASKILTAS